MTLKEKFRDVLKNHFQRGKEEELLLNSVDDSLEKIADEFAIELTMWCLTLLINDGVPPGEDLQEALKIFKKEKGL